MHANKSLGLDSFNPGFYQKFWGIVGDLITDTCMQWLENSIFQPNLCRNNVVLIPKCESRSTMKDLGLISLCNVVYKILA